MRWTITGVALSACCVVVASAEEPVRSVEDPSSLGVGWSMQRLDLEVRVSNRPPAMTVAGAAVLRLEMESSLGPSLNVNTNTPAMTWTRLDAPPGARVEINARHPEYEAARLAHVRFDEPLRLGDEVRVEFEVTWEKLASQLGVAKDFAIASWTGAWHPFALPRLDRGEEFTARVASAPGSMTLHLPPSWIALADGRLIRREQSEDGTVETWDSSDAAIARSFAAGRYTAAERDVDGRQIRVYLLGEKSISVDRLAELISKAMAAQEARLGPFPFAGYGVAEVPDRIPGWYAASQQSFIMAKSGAFEYAHGNLPLWSHEMCHGWWGNTVGTKPPGEKMVGEALAQYGAVIAIEAIDGREKMIEFLEFSRSGYNARQCAKGFFEMMRSGQDCALASMDSSSLTGGNTHNLADSKGMWVYHMLRHRLGDDVFFSVLRGLIDRFAGRELSLDDLRAAYIEAAPDQKLDQFFEQWLDRPGAPVLSTDLRGGADGATEVWIEQAPGERPFQLDLDVRLNFEGGEHEIVSVAIEQESQRVHTVHGKKVVDVELDPDRKLLIWRPAYGPQPTASTNTE
jgi:hypothetical protein